MKLLLRKIHILKQNVVKKFLEVHRSLKLIHFTPPSSAQSMCYSFIRTPEMLAWGAVPSLAGDFLNWRQEWGPGICLFLTRRSFTTLQRHGMHSKCENLRI